MANKTFISVELQQAYEDVLLGGNKVIYSSLGKWNTVQ